MGTGTREWLKDPRWQALLLAACIVIFAIVPWFVPISHIEAHNILHHLNFIPLMIAGMLFGWRGAIIATIFAGLAHLPFVLHSLPISVFEASDQMVELSIFGAAGIIAGLLSDRERRQRAKQLKTSQELERVYQELQDNLERFKKSERLSAAGQLSARLAHEIRNPLASISGAAGILRRGHAPSEAITECLDIIDKESQRLNKLLTNFLDFARPRTPRFQRTELEPVIESVVILAAHSTGSSQVRLLHEPNGNIPEVDCDPEQLKQVLLNLLINAVQASPAGGVVSIDASSQTDRVSIAVRDQGSGIPEEHRDRIFDPFFTTKDRGTGLGLAIASMIVEQHGGILNADRNADKGMTFRLDLPRRRDHPL